MRTASTFFVLTALAAASQASFTINSVGSFLGDQTETFEGLGVSNVSDAAVKSRNLFSGTGSISIPTEDPGLGIDPSLYTRLFVYDNTVNNGVNNYYIGGTLNSGLAGQIGTRALGIDNQGTDVTATVLLGGSYASFGGYWQSGYGADGDKSPIVISFFELSSDTTAVASVSFTPTTLTNNLGWFGWSANGGTFQKITISGYYAAVDNLQVKVAAVPEPATMAALGLGAVAVLRRRRRA